ncbi:hypothetical protein GCM10011344_12840 [Dokdonia pacifica]|uniref:Uncharacterized protein n=1 Tax=Dokdonia pacifica TaxID=1627892 RepID=A0A238WAH0_9FLAO|nr:hypothetical protein [Dokdonia pacifica]GGG13591.1 hypothetical protein GCM10011344_12840 [Dokdonia pacifica]SNR43498.1 hypothetical protein SAMN06265376_101867 [Dokdonia pacifica]
MHRVILIFFLCCLACQEKEPCDYIEDYYQQVYQAELAYLEKDYQTAYDALKKVESQCDLLNQQIIQEPLMLARLSVILGKPEEAFPYLERMLSEGFYIETFENDEILEPLKGHEKWKELASKELDLLLAYRNQLNQDLRKEILEMNEEDQAVRINESRKKDMNTVDSIHKKRIKEIFKEYGYPHKGLVGKSSMGERTDIKVLLMHFLEPEYFTPLLLESTRKGIAPPGYVGFIVDRKNLADRDSFTYGIYDNADATQIKDFKNLDKRRISVGLPPWRLKKKVDSLRRAYLYN